MIEIQLLGKPVVCRDGEKISFSYQKVEGLFYYLCVNKRVSRNQAVQVLWADNSEESARKNLRDAIYNIRKALGQEILLMEGNTVISLNLQSDIHMDIDSVSKENILEIWKGGFLQFFYVKNCYEFEEWMEQERTQWKRRFVREIQLKILSLKSGQGMEILEETGHILVNNGILDEDIYRNILKKLAEAGHYLAAIEIYQEFEKFLEREVEAVPEEETRLLYEKICDMKNKMKPSVDKKKEYFFGRTDVIYHIYSKVCTKEESKSGHRSFLLSGEPGIGKSMLLRQIQDMLSDTEFLMFSWNCCETEKELYLKPWHGIMERVDEYCKAQGLEEESPADILFGQNVPDIQFFMTRFEILTESVFRYLAKYFKEQRIILFFDDIQWMDSMSLRLMSNLLFRMGSSQLIVIAAGREDNQEEWNSFRIPLVGRGILKEVELQPFTQVEVEQIIRETGMDLPGGRDGVLELHKKTQGNPLFFMESLELLKTGKDSDFTDKMSHIIGGRLLSLSRDENTVLNVVSIFSTSVTLVEIQNILSIEEGMLLDILEELIERKLLAESLREKEVRYSFRHQIIKEYVYQSMSEGKRKIYHSHIAGFYETAYKKGEGLELCSLLIYHFECCGNLYKTFEYKIEYLKAFYSISYDIYPLLSRRTAFCSSIDGHYAREDELTELAKEIRAAHRQDEQMTAIHMKVEYLLGRYEIFVRDIEYGLSCIQKSMELAQQLNDRDYIFYNYMQLVFYGEIAGQADFMRQAIDDCKEFMKDCTHHYLEEECMLKRVESVYLTQNERYEEAEALLQDAVRILKNEVFLKEASRKELSACCHRMGLCMMRQKKWKEALDWLEKAIMNGGKKLLSGETGVFYSDKGLSLAHLGRLEEAEQDMDKASACFAMAGSVWGDAKMQMCRAYLEKMRGHDTEFENYRARGEELAKKLDSTFLWEELKYLEE